MNQEWVHESRVGMILFLVILQTSISITILFGMVELVNFLKLY